MIDKRKESRINFGRNLKSAVIAGLLVGVLVGLVLGLKVSRINPSITNFGQVWVLTSHLIVLYAFAGMVCGFVLGLVFYPFIMKKGLKRIRSLFNLYLPVILLLTLYHYFRVYVLTHFIANPLMPIKGSLWANIGFTLVFLVLTVFAIKLAVRITGKLRLNRIAGCPAVLFIVIWIFAGLFFSRSGAKQEAVASAIHEYGPEPNKVKVAVIGLDGAWWEIINPLMAEGKLPNFQKLVDSGTKAELKTLYPTFSAMIWSSIATGKLPQKHGINSFLVWSFPLTGAKIPMFRLPYLAPELLWIQENIATVSPIPSNYRQAASIWNIFSDIDMSVGVINWWATFPAEEVNGYVYSDHALFNKMQVLTNYKERQGASIYDVYPPEMITEIVQFAYTPNDLTFEDLTRFVAVESDGFWNEVQRLDTYDYLDIAYEASMFKYSFPGDKTVIDAAEYLLRKKGQPDFWAIYIQGLDSMSHQYLKYHFWMMHENKLIPINIARYKDLITRYYQYMDEALGQFIALLEANTVLIVVSDHGFDNEMLPTGHYHHIKPDFPGESEEFHVIDSHPGIFIASGPGIKENYTAEDITVLDITPTILAVMGLPYAADMDGKAALEIFQQPMEMDTITTYGRPMFDDTIMETSVDKDVRDKLKALGYVK